MHNSFECIVKLFPTLNTCVRGMQALSVSHTDPDHLVSRIKMRKICDRLLPDFKVIKNPGGT